MNNLKNIYNKINNCLDKLYNYDDCSRHIDLVNEMSECIDLLSGFFCIRMLKVDIGPFKKDEMVYIHQDEAGAWMDTLDNNDKRCIDLFDYLGVNIEDWFYSIPEPPVDTGEKTISGDIKTSRNFKENCKYYGKIRRNK